MEAISPQCTYALNKQRACGGSLEQWEEEYDHFRKRQEQILKERNLLQEDRIGRSDKTLTEAGLINLSKTALRAALTYGFWNVRGLYGHLLENKEVLRKREIIRNHLGITNEELNTLEHRVKELLGPEFITIDKELRKYF